MTLTRNHAELTLEVAKHIKADAIIKRTYWDGSKGCFIGCLTHSSDPKPAFERFGLPEPLMRIAESIFEALPDDECIGFFAALPDAVACDGKDLSRVHWAFLAAELRALPNVPADIQAVIDPVVAGMDLLADGKDWPKDAAHAAAHAAYAAARAAYAAAAHAAARAADAAAYAAYVADSADSRMPRDAADAAADAADAAADAEAADAAYAAARIRQRDTLLRLISEAPMGEKE
jgi:hypothetical protein